MKDWMGWTASVAVAAALFGGAAAAALRQAPGVTADEGPVAVAMDLSIGMVAAPPPAVAAAQSPAQPAPPPEPAPTARPKSAPEASTAMAPVAPQTLPRPDQAEALPQMETAAPVAPVAAKEPPKQRPKPRPHPTKAVEKPEAQPRKPKQDQPKEKPKKATKAAPSAPSGGAADPAKPAAERKKAGGGDAASYGKTVLKKIAKLSRKPAPGKGQATVGFVIAADGRLKQVVILSSSGSAALDKVALDHVRRAAPFPAPPQGAQSSFSFEFEAK